MTLLLSDPEVLATPCKSPLEKARLLENYNSSTEIIRRIAKCSEFLFRQCLSGKEAKKAFGATTWLRSKAFTMSVNSDVLSLQEAAPKERSIAITKSDGG